MVTKATAWVLQWLMERWIVGESNLTVACGASLAIGLPFSLLRISMSPKASSSPKPQPRALARASLAAKRPAT